MKRDSLLYRITCNKEYLPNESMQEGLSHLFNNDKVSFDEQLFKAKATAMRTMGSMYLLYSPKNHRLFDQGGTEYVLGSTVHWKLATQVHGKMHPLSQCFNAIQLHLLLDTSNDEGGALHENEKTGTGVVLYKDIKGGWMLMSKEISLVKLTAIKSEVGVGEILTPVCRIPEGLLTWVYPLLSIVEFRKKNEAGVQSYLQQLISDSEIFSQHQLNIIKALKENHSYRKSLRTLAEENGVNYETLKTQTLRIRDKVNEHFKTTYTDSLSAIRFIILSNLV